MIRQRWKYLVPVFICICGLSLVGGFYLCQATRGDDVYSEFRNNAPEYTGVFVSAETPDEVVSGELCTIILTVKELEGRPRIIKSIWINGFYLVRSIGFASLESFIESSGNHSQGWQRISVSIPLDAYEQITIELRGTSGVAGPAHGILTLEFEDQSRIPLPVQFDVIDP